MQNIFLLATILSASCVTPFIKEGADNVDKARPIICKWTFKPEKPKLQCSGSDPLHRWGPHCAAQVDGLCNSCCGSCSSRGN